MPETPSALTYRLATAPRSAQRTANAAIAIIDLHGDLSALAHCLSIPSVPEPGQIRLVRIPDIDEVLLVCISPDHAQIHAHAGPVVLSRLASTLKAAGLTPATLDPTGLDDRLAYWLAHAPSPLAIDLLLAQRRLRQSLPKPQAADPRLDRLLHPPLVAAIGRPNVGKSSMLNALARRGVALVSNLPGTTRDAVGASLLLEGLVVRWIDLPGLHETGDAIEAEAIRRASSWASRADLVLLCSDGCSPAPAGIEGVPTLPVLTKADLHPAATPSGAIACSARTGQGVAQLASAIAECLVPASIRNPDTIWELPSP
jgi:small GTP-binding protein